MRFSFLLATAPTLHTFIGSTQAHALYRYYRDVHHSINRDIEASRTEAVPKRDLGDLEDAFAGVTSAAGAVATEVTQAFTPPSNGSGIPPILTGVDPLVDIVSAALDTVKRLERLPCEQWPDDCAVEICVLVLDNAIALASSGGLLKFVKLARSVGGSKAALALVTQARALPLAARLRLGGDVLNQAVKEVLGIDDVQDACGTPA